MKPLLIGVDTGITTAIAVLDLEKNILSLKSDRNFSTSDIIKYISKIGKPLIISTDKKRPPIMIAKLASSYNSKLFVPNHDLSIEEKDKLTTGFKTDNIHEKDALAAALFAYKFYSPQFRKVDSVSTSESESDKIKELLISKKASNISEAVEMLKPKKVEEKPVMKKQEFDWERHYELLKRKLTDKERSYEILKLYSQKLEERIKNLQKQRKERLEEELKKNQETRKRIMKEKEIEGRNILIKQLQYELAKEKMMIKAYEERFEKEEEFKRIKDEGNIAVIIMDNFTKDAIVKANREFKIKDQVVYFENQRQSKQAARTLISLQPRIVLGELNEKMEVMLRNAGIPVVSMKPELRKYFAFVSSKEIESQLKKSERKNFLKWLSGYRNR